MDAYGYGLWVLRAGGDQLRHLHHLRAEFLPSQDQTRLAGDGRLLNVRQAPQRDPEERPGDDDTRRRECDRATEVRRNEASVRAKISHSLR